MISLISELITSVFNFLTIRDLSQKFFCLLISGLIHLSSGYILFLILILLKHTFANEFKLLYNCAHFTCEQGYAQNPSS